MIDVSLLKELVPSLAALLIVALIVLAVFKSALPLLNSLRDSFADVNTQQERLIDRIEKLNQREMDAFQRKLDEATKELETERLARADLERRLNEAARDLITLRAELATVQSDRARVQTERDEMATKVKTLEKQVAEMQNRLDQANGTTKPKRSPKKESEG